jgi:hypothetical protein
MSAGSDRGSARGARDDGRNAAPAGERPPYQPPRIVKKRAVSQATLFTGSGPEGGGVIG